MKRLRSTEDRLLIRRVAGGNDAAGAEAKEQPAEDCVSCAELVTDPIRWLETGREARKAVEGRYTRAMLAKRVWWSTKASCTSPVGPFRCLAMMISAVPLSGESGLYNSSR